MLNIACRPIEYTSTVFFLSTHPSLALALRFLRFVLYHPNLLLFRSLPFLPPLPISLPLAFRILPSTLRFSLRPMINSIELNILNSIFSNSSVKLY